MWGAKDEYTAISLLEAPYLIEALPKWYDNCHKIIAPPQNPWWRHQMETFSVLLAICLGNSPVPGEFPAQRPVTRSFEGFFDLRLNKRLIKQSWGWWFETLSCPLWRHCNEAWIKWPTISKQRIPKLFLKENLSILIQISLKLDPECRVDSKSTLVEAIPAPMLVKIFNAITRLSWGNSGNR